jgi:hypothetical protein
VPKVKRTYNLAERTVRTVRELSEQYQLERTQDGVVELAVEELERRLREEAEAHAWEHARSDAEFVAETAAVEQAYRTADRETWPA